MNLCPQCLRESGHRLSCACGNNHPFKVLGRDDTGTIAQCMACGQIYNQIKAGMTPLAEVGAQAAPDGSLLAVMSCPKHAAYRVGMPKVSVSKCPNCGFEKVTQAMANNVQNDLQKAQDDPESVRRAIMGI